MLIVGLTGGISCGKSTVSDRISRKHKLTIVDADLIARQVVEPGKKAYNQIVEAFSKDIPNLICDDLSLNRGALGSAVFGNPEKLKKLNSIVHPAVRREIGWQLLKAYIGFNRMVILDVPLLFDSGLDRICGMTVSVHCKKDIQIKRLMKRNPELSEEDCHKRIDSQMGSDERNFRSDHILCNNGTLGELEKSIDSLVKEITPGWTISLLDYFPPVGIISAIYTILLRYFTEKYRGTQPKSKSD